MELGALDDIIVELPGICQPRGGDIVVSSNAPQIECWELERNDPCVCVSSVGKDIVQWLLLETQLN